jgi:hypothetical protein
MTFHGPGVRFIWGSACPGMGLVDFRPMAGRTVKEGWVPDKHGVYTSYNRGCRCRACTDAGVRRANAQVKQRMLRRVLVDGHLVYPDPPPGHGKRITYFMYGCRCDSCREAAMEYQRAYRARKRAAATTG